MPVLTRHLFTRKAGISLLYILLKAKLQIFDSSTRTFAIVRYGFTARWPNRPVQGWPAGLDSVATNQRPETDLFTAPFRSLLAAKRRIKDVSGVSFWLQNPWFEGKG